MPILERPLWTGPPRRLAATSMLAPVLAGLLAPTAFAAPKTDVVVLKNGDRLTGEVQQLERGRLQLKTDDLGTVEIEWDKVASVTATAPFDVDDLAGNRYLGSLAPGPGTGQLVIAWKGHAETVDLLKVVRIRRLDTSFWGRLDGSLDVGASYTSASSLFKLDLAGTLGVERPGYEVTLDGSSTLSSQPGVEDTRRSALSLAYVRRFENRWVAFVLAQVEQNRELGFDLRSSAAGGGGRYLAQSRRYNLLAGVGLSLNRERPTEGESTTNVEALGLLSYDRFSYDFPKVDVSIRLIGFASLSQGGRYRVELDARLKRELVKDFHATLRGYESYDSRPATEGAPTDDYGITFALGWTF
jgi:Protein of unknown function, DUF481